MKSANTGDSNGVGLPEWPEYSDGEKVFDLVLQADIQGGFSSKSIPTDW